MTYFLRALRLSLRSRLRRPGFWAFFMLLAALVCLLRVHGQSASDASRVRIGLVLPSVGGEDFARALQANAGAVVEFVPTDEATAEREVAAGRWDCALLLADDYEERLERGEYEKLVTVLSGPASALAPLVREPAAAAIARRAAPDLAMAYLKSRGVADEALLAAAQKQLAAGLADEQLVHVRAETLRGEPLDAVRLADLGASRLARGCLAVALLVWMLLAAADLIRWRDTPAARRLAPCMARSLLLLPRLLSYALPALLAGALGLLAVGEADGRGLLALSLYLALLTALALLLGVLAPSAGVLTLLIPYAAAACLILSPVLLDVAALYPALAPLSRILPVTLYLRAPDGGAALSRLFAATLALALCVPALEFLARRFAANASTTQRRREKP